MAKYTPRQKTIEKYLNVMKTFNAERNKYIKTLQKELKGLKKPENYDKALIIAPAYEKIPKSFKSYEDMRRKMRKYSLGFEKREQIHIQRYKIKLRDSIQTKLDTGAITAEQAKTEQAEIKNLSDKMLRKKLMSGEINSISENYKIAYDSP